MSITHAVELFTLFIRVKLMFNGTVTPYTGEWRGNLDIKRLQVKLGIVPPRNDVLETFGAVAYSLRS